MSYHTHTLFNDVELVKRSIVQREEEAEEIITLGQKVSWGETDLNLPEQLANGGDGEGVMIYIADTGLHRHVDIPKPIWADNHTSDSDVYDGNNHSTWINGKISALDNDIGFRGFSPKADIGIVKVLNNRGSGSRMASGMRAAMNHWNGIKNNYLCAFYSMSYGGGGYSAEIERLFAEMLAIGFIPVAAAGNESRGQSSYPALYRDVVSIGAYDKNREQTSFTNYGPSIDFVAPGAGQYSTVNLDDYAIMNGTSMACPTWVACASNLISSRPRDKWIHNRYGIVEAVKEFTTDLPGTWDGDGIFEPAKSITRSKYFVF